MVSAVGAAGAAGAAGDAGAPGAAGAAGAAGDWTLATLTPAIRTGRAALDVRRLPRDEFEARVRGLEVLLRAHRLAAAVVVAHAATPAECVYLTNFAPTARLATVIVVPGHTPVLMAGLGGQREAAFQRGVTWLHELVHRPFSAGAVRAVLADRGVKGGRIGIVGLDDQVPLGARDEFVSGMAEYELVGFDRELVALRRRKSVRELALLGEIDELLTGTAARGIAAFHRSGSPAKAAAALEHEARERGCRDVRVLLGRPDGSLRPFEHVDADRDTLFVCYVASELLGYWRELAFTYPWSALPSAADLRPVVAAAVAALRPGPLPLAPARARVDMRIDVRIDVRGAGVELVDLPDASSGWDALEPGDPVTVVAGATSGGRLLLHSESCVVGEHGPFGARTVAPTPPVSDPAPPR